MSLHHHHQQKERGSQQFLQES